MSNARTTTRTAQGAGAEPWRRVRSCGETEHAPELLPGKRHSQVAVEDPIKPGEHFVNIIEALREERRRAAGTTPDNPA